MLFGAYHQQKRERAKTAFSWKW